jgi:hypothetical protein
MEGVGGGGPKPDRMPSTIDDAADEPECGGRGIWARCDHTVNAELEALFQRVRAEQDGGWTAGEQRVGGYEGNVVGLPRSEAQSRLL